MYNIILTNENIINVKADEVEWIERDRMVSFICKGRTVARINMNNVIGWIETDNKTESEKK